MKTRVNFNLPSEVYKMIKEIADEEGSSSADIFRRAIKKYVFEYKTQDLNKFYLNKDKPAIDCNLED